MTEALLILNGRLELELAGRTMSLTAHDLCLVPANTPHAVLPGNAGTLLIVEGDDEHDEGRAAALN
ncbi:cupin domain-containing protein [Streptomyces sp. e14]|uniref:cupin domain-containing protein n=1 Tax=Streptomyces sp. e14 TaxID=645465 RepID=UPI0002FF4395|nr:cupin domain-containing protein [Streptomyces sp. e14]